MLKRYQVIVCGLFRVTDGIIIVGAWLASYALRYNLTTLDVTGRIMPPFDTYSALAPLVGVLWMTVFSLMRLYESHRMKRISDEVLLVIKAHLAALLLFIAIAFTFKEYHYSRLVIAYFGTVGCAALVGFRVLLRTALRHLRNRGYNLRSLLLVGEGPQAERLIQELSRHPELGVQIAGVVVSQEFDQLHSGGRLAGKKVVGRYEHIEVLVEEHRVDGVMLSLPPAHQGYLDSILRRLADEAIDVHLVPDLTEYATLGCRVEQFGDFPVLRINESPLGGGEALLKRIADLAISSLGLLAISPLLLLIAVAIKLTSRGPVLYTQERMGLDGKTFRIFKFRSMRTDADAPAAGWTKKGDSRCTPLGALLRRTSLDELPQLWNVIRGEMSLVGPRPERPVFVDQFRKKIPHYMLRHKVKAGITGWAQVNGWRGDTSLDRRIECDLYYIQNWSIGFDIRILLMTFWKGFMNKNAY